MKRAVQIMILLLSVVGLSFYLGMVVNEKSAARTIQDEKKRDPQGRFFPTPPFNLPKQKASFGMTGSIAFRVNNVFSGSPAQQLGLQRGDFIVEIDGKQFFSIGDLMEMLAEKNPGDEVDVAYIRFNEESKQREYKRGKVQMGPLNK